MEEISMVPLGSSSLTRTLLGAQVQITVEASILAIGLGHGDAG